MKEILKKESEVNAGSATQALVGRHSQEVQASMVMAKQFPRDYFASCEKIRQQCQRRTLAEQAVYSYPRGGQRVTGPSIRLAEVIAQCWGNIDTGIIELNRTTGKSEMMAYAWDLESNTRVTKVFSVEHKREKKTGNIDLTDPRDIYEITANMGTRRMRACILAVIPGDVVDEAIANCEQTMRGKYEEVLADRVKKMLASFNDEYRVSKDMIEAHFGYNVEALAESDYEKLRTIYNSLKDGMSKRGDWFVVAKKAASSLDA